VGAAAADHLGDTLAEAAQPERVAGDLGGGPEQADDVALGGVGTLREEDVRGGEREEVDAVGVQDRAEVERLAQQRGRARRGDREDLID
jgi:hypothetical protein